MLPYMLDSHAEGTRRSVLRSPDQEPHRGNRKVHGVFFTPGDVAEYMIDRLLEDRDPGTPCPSVVDPACGTGVFLRTAHRHLIRLGHALSDVLASLHGIDISSHSIDSAAVVLLLEALSTDRDLEPSKAWMIIRSRLVVGDSLSLVSSRHKPLSLLSQDVAEWPSGWPARFDLVVGNPPYAPLGERGDLELLRLAFESLRSGGQGTNRYLPFLEMMWLLRSDDGSACMVVPMAIAYATTAPTKAVRKGMMRAGGSWDFAFFDRTPDALFGDDVKQRIAVVTHHAAKMPRLFTGPVTRWTSRTRHGLFASLRSVELGNTDISEGVPRLGSSREADTLRVVQEASPVLGDLAELGRAEIRPGMSADVVLVAPTAYNWLSVYRTADWVTALDAPTKSPFTTLRAASSEMADSMYALLTSKFIYWLWRACGDGFHVPISFLRALPVPDANEAVLAELAYLGRQLWAQVQLHPIHSANGGRSSVTYSPWSCWAIVDRIDGLLLDSLGLPEGFRVELGKLVRKNILVDRSDSSRVRKGSWLEVE
jgi:SAM-dependent methyltransferase